MAGANISENSKRIAKNTVLLYFRMLVLMLVGLFTSRVVLRSLGQEDFGIYGAVAGVVTMFTILTGSMSAAISRFITFELGKKDNRLPQVFSTAVSIQLVLCAIIIVLSEPIGLWWLNNKMVIPPERLEAARWVLQFSILSLVIQLISVPYNAAIVAHERMDAFAWISIFEGVGKLAVAYCLMVSSGDRLVLYAALLALVSLITRFMYGYFCRKHFEECKYEWILDKPLFGEMFSFAGWNFIGSGAAILRDQGGNQLLNIFFGPLVNAAWLIATQVNGIVLKFVTSFTTAINPQITKSYASGSKEYCYHLVFKGSRLSVYLLLLVIIPVLFNTPFLLEIWLGKGQVPENAVLFVRLSLVCMLIDTVSQTLITLMNATGNIRNYQLVVGGLLLLNAPVDYVFLKVGYSPYVIYIVAITLSVCCFLARMLMLHRQLGFPAGEFMTKVAGNLILVSALSSALPMGLSQWLPLDTWWGPLLCAGGAFIWTALCIVFVGFDKEERKNWTERVLKRFHDTICS